MENIGLAEVHPSMHTINPVAHPGTLCYVVIPAEEDHLVYIALELHLPPYHHVGRRVSALSVDLQENFACVT